MFLCEGIISAQAHWKTNKQSPTNENRKKQWLCSMELAFLILF